MLCTEIFSLLCSGGWMAGDFCAHVRDCTENKLLAGSREGKAHPLTLLCKEPVTDYRDCSLHFIAY